MALVPVDWRPSSRKLREFAVALVVFSILACTYLRMRHGVSWTTLAIVEAIVLVAAVLGLLAPPLLRPLFVGISVLVWPIGFVVSWVLLAVIYYGLVTPIGLLRRAIGGDPLQRRFDPEKPSYWEPKAERRGSERYFQQY
jgi:hypothetical protein